MVESQMHNAYHSLLDSLEKSNRLSLIYNRFLEVTEDVDRVKFVSKLPEVITMDIPVESGVTFQKSPKQQEADFHDLKNSAYDAFKKGEYMRSLQVYTSALSCACTAPEEDKHHQLRLGYTNRSSTLFKMREYLACIRDVDRALKYISPEKSSKTCVLLLRKAKCHHIMGNLEQCDEILNLCRARLDMYDELAPIILKALNVMQKEIKRKMARANRHPNNSLTDTNNPQKEVPIPIIDGKRSKMYPVATDMMTVEYSETKGRHYLATEDIPIGKSCK